MLSTFAGVLLFMGVGLFFVAAAIVFSRLIRPRGEYSPGKYMSYECGEVPVGSAWIQFNIRFYVIALIFIIFDVEIIFLLPWALGDGHVPGIHERGSSAGGY